MAVANAEGRLALATGNKSELSMGYCTLYGDTVGGLAVLGDVFKHDVYALARRTPELLERCRQPWQVRGRGIPNAASVDVVKLLGIESCSERAPTTTWSAW